MDKEFAKKLAAADGIPVGPYAVLRSGQSLSAADRDRLGLPVFVKPSRAGSSVGISKVRDWAQLDAAVAAAREVDPKVLVEAALAGREIEVGVLAGEHGGAAEASVCGEIRLTGAGHEFYDFDAKYLEDASEFDVPADLPEAVAQRIRDLSLRAFAALDCAGLARVDFFVTADFDVYLNEINTMPGFTHNSLFPQLWAASGLEYPKLVSRLVYTALRRGTGLH
jgi:D-alanine-D-alanine ligase